MVTVDTVRKELMAIESAELTTARTIKANAFLDITFTAPCFLEPSEGPIRCEVGPTGCSYAVLSCRGPIYSRSPTLPITSAYPDRCLVDCSGHAPLKVTGGM